MKVSINLSPEAHQRLIVHAAMVRKDRNELVEELILTHLRRFVVSDRSRNGEAADDDAGH